MSSLRELRLHSVSIDSAGLQLLLAKLPELRSLGLASTMLNDEGLAIVAGFTQLEHLDVLGTKVTDHSIAQLGKLTELRELDLSSTDVTDKGVSHLRVVCPPKLDPV